MAEHRVHLRSWVRASADELRTGLLGYVSVLYGALVLDGITLRRTTGGRVALSFPAGAGRGGRKRSYIRPADKDARQTLEREILAQLARWQDLGVATTEGQP